MAVAITGNTTIVQNELPGKTASDLDKLAVRAIMVLPLIAAPMY
jgi:hypothetical protein